MPFVIRSASFTITTAATINVTTPGGGSAAQLGDLLVIIHQNDFYNVANMGTPSVTTGTPTVTNIPNATADDGATGGHQKWYWAEVNTPGAQTVTVTESAPGDEDKSLVVLVIAGADTTTPIDGSANANGAGGTSNLHVCPSASPGTSTGLMVCAANPGGGASFGSYGFPGSMTAQVNQQQGGITIGVATEQLAASGPTGTRTFTAITNSTRWVASTVVIREGAAGGSIAPDSVTDPITLGAPTLSQSMSITPDGLNVPILLGSPALSQPTPLGFDPVLAVGQQILECLCDTVALMGNRAPQNCCFRVGLEVPYDIDAHTDLCCEGLAYVALGDIYPSLDSFPEQDIVRQTRCGISAWAVDFRIGIIRCIPVGDENNMPSCDDWTTAAYTNYLDAQVLRQVTCCLLERIGGNDSFLNGLLVGMSRVVERQQQGTPQGGCVERFMNINFQIPECDC